MKALKHWKKIEEEPGGKTSCADWLVRSTFFLTKAIYRFNIHPIKILKQFFTEIENTCLNFTQKYKESNIEKCTLNNKGTPGVITVPDFQLFYRAQVIRIAWDWLFTDILINGMGLKTHVYIIHTLQTLDFSKMPTRHLRKGNLQQMVLVKLDSSMQNETGSLPLLIYKTQLKMNQGPPLMNWIKTYCILQRSKFQS